ncbi:transcriptional repressor [Mycobacterium phage Curiosium]|uniref:Helix-turn-helix DNA binding protein n=1 Tax=Mycobacterium phage Curiosium TaxID=2599859 RepID=A0A5J6TUV9_9CAUD|nr:transcriptional repressor [Mycobacterium phage Curiosium]QFG14148.1 helix-turn-helix DNA binding protein [Mycobacterium phage Curiosium]
MPQTKYELVWITENVAKLMADNGIRYRSDLAKLIGLGRTTVYEAFAPDWSGTATHTVLAHVAGYFGVSITRLVVDPGKRTRNRKAVPVSGLTVMA